MSKDLPARDKPLVTAIMQGPRRMLASVDEAAERLGVNCGMTVTHAQTLISDLCVVDATPDKDEDALIRLALWCVKYSPLVTPDPPNGVFSLAATVGRCDLHIDTLKVKARNFK